MSEPRPRVADVIPRLQLRGAEIFAQHLEAALRDRYRCRLLPLYGGPDRRAPTGVELDVVPGVPDGPGRMARAAWSLRERARAFAPGLVVAHGGDPLRYAVLAGVHRRAPLVGVRVAAVTPDLRTPARSRTLRWAYARVDAFVAVSRSLADELAEVFGVPRERIRVIANGRPAPPKITGDEREALRRSLGATPGDVLVAWVGRLVREKDPVAVAALSRQLAGLAPAARVAVVGTGPLEREARAAAGGDARIVFAGERDDAPQVIAAADLLVSTSATEGAPGVLIEALLAGVPVVAYDVGGVRDVASGETGALVPSGDPMALATEVARLANDGAARAAASEAAARAAAPFRIEAVADAYDALYRELLDRR